MNKNFMIKFNFFSNILILFILFFGGAIYADTNGIWSFASDVRGGTFGSDEGTPVFSFMNKLGIGTTTPTTDLDVNGSIKSKNLTTNLIQSSPGSNLVIKLN